MPCPAIYERATQGRQPRGEASPFKSGDQEGQCKALCLSSLWVLVQEHPETGQVPPGKPPWAGFRGGGGTNGGCKEEKDPDVAGHPQGNQPHAYHGNSPAVLQTRDSMCPTKSYFSLCVFLTAYTQLPWRTGGQRSRGRSGSQPAWGGRGRVSRGGGGSDCSSILKALPFTEEDFKTGDLLPQ